MYCLKPPVLVSVCGVGCRCGWFWEGCLELASCWSVSVDGYEIVASLAGGIFLDDVW